MHPEVSELERLRVEIEDHEGALGMLYDFQAYMKPKGRYAEETAARIAEHEAASAALREQLRQRLADLRRETPQVVAFWVQWHREQGQIILEHLPKDRDHLYHAQVARETLAAWEQVLAGNKEYVPIFHYLFPRYAEASARLAGRAKG